MEKLYSSQEQNRICIQNLICTVTEHLIRNTPCLPLQFELLHFLVAWIKKRYCFTLPHHFSEMSNALVTTLQAAIRNILAIKGVQTVRRNSQFDSY